MIIGNRLVLDFSVDKELYWVDRKQGGRLYHFFNLGVYHMNHIKDNLYVLSLTVPFAQLKIGWIFR